MNDDTHDIEAALQALKPNRLPADLTNRLTIAATAPRSRVIPFFTWGAPLAAAASLAFLLFASPADESLAPQAVVSAAAAAPEPGLRLVRAEQIPAEVTLLEPVKLAEGSFARPMRVRWHNAATYRDASSGAELVRFAPHDEVVGLVPFETD